ncbi:hypothetical protein U6G28_03640 [Actinomycetaceae bacterium MB13-C1-2]|nr:hypothetical protein U6G28_03640 [Actinomycetaceae bacterium MB13-C1-2]
MTDYDELANRAEQGELQPIPGTALYGEGAATAARELLMVATGASTLDEAQTLAVGRPRVGQEKGASPTLRARVPQALKNSVAALAKEQNRPESEIVREAIAVYVSSHGQIATV